MVVIFFYSFEDQKGGGVSQIWYSICIWDFRIFVTVKGGAREGDDSSAGGGGGFTLITQSQATTLEWNDEDISTG